MAVIPRSKHGVLYLFLAVIFVALFAALFLTFQGYQYQDEQEVISLRVHTMDDFVADLHEDLDRAAFISGFRSLIGVEEYLSQRGTFFDNQSSMEESFRVVFLQGSYNGTDLFIMENASFTDYIERVRVQAQRIGLNLTVNITNVTIEQSTPWVVLVRFTGSFIVADNLHESWWNYTERFDTEVPIYGLKDPLYTVNTLGRVPNMINEYALPPEGYVDDDNDTAVLKEFLEGSYYRESSGAPSFVQRFTNNLSSSPLGIESLVYLPALSDQGVVVKSDRGVVDHIYFSAGPDNSTDRCQVQNMIYTPDWFRLDQGHMDDYELDNLSSSPCG
ncbi:hypothetical protein GF367_00540 [Candidatus Woesearchaeota archaeon]|nr:hypothetical protein [Candidatus Woesearchaeota archaeon]